MPHPTDCTLKLPVKRKDLGDISYTMLKRPRNLEFLDSLR